MCRRMRHLKPREIQGCTLALDASIATSLYDATSGGSLVAADGAVARWEDQSGNGNHVTQGTSANRPLRRVAARGGSDALQKNAATATRMATASFYPSAGSADVSIVSVSLAVSGSAYSTAWQYGSSMTTGARAAWLPTYDTTKSAVDFNNSYIGRSGSPTENANWNTHSYLAGSASTIAATSQAVNSSPVTENYTLSGTSSLNIGTGIPFAVMNNDSSALPIGYLALVATWNRALGQATLKRIECAAMRKWRING